MITLPDATYLANLALHAFILAAVAVAMPRCFKNPSARSLAAVIGLLAVAVIPWFSALAVPARANSFTAMVAVTRPTPAVVVLPDSATAIGSPATVPVARPIAPPNATEIRISPTWLCAGLWIGGSMTALAIMAAAQVRFLRWQRRLRLPTTAEIELIERQWATAATSWYVWNGLEDETVSPRHLGNIRPSLEESPAGCRTQPARRRRSPFFGLALRIGVAGESPGVFGLWRLNLLLPEDLLEPGRSSELRWALHHEAAHLRGHDLRWAAAIQCVRAVYWWNPLVHYLAGLWSEAREQCCDRQALASADEAGDYGAFLVRLAGRRTPATVLPMAGGAFRRIKQRLSSLLADPEFRPCGRRFVAGGVVAALLTGVALSQLGLRAEAPAKPAESAPAPKPAAPAENPATLPQCKIVARLVIAPKAVVPHGAVLTAAQLKQILERAADSKTEAVTHLPSIMMKMSQAGYVSCIWEHPDSPHEVPAAGTDLTDDFELLHPPPPIDDPRYRFTGLIALMSPEIAGAKVRLAVNAGLGYVAGMPASQLFSIEKIPRPDGTFVTDPADIPWDRVVKHLAKSTAVLAGGESLCLDFGDLEPGKTGTLIVTPTPLSRTGSDVADFAVRFPAPPPSLHVPLMVSGALIELDDADLAVEGISGSGATAIFTKELTQKIMAAVKGPVTTLPPRRFESGNDRAALWPELPQLLLKAGVSSLPVTAVDLDFRLLGKNRDGMSLYLYPGYTLAYQSPPDPKGAKRRLLLLTIDLPEK